MGRKLSSNYEGATMIKPVRLQRKRTKGFRLVSPNGLPIVCCGRPSKYGNPFYVGKPKDCGCRSAGECMHNVFVCDTAQEAVDAYRSIERSEKRLAEIRRELGGKNLSCWCDLDQPCHVDVLLEIANP